MTVLKLQSFIILQSLLPFCTCYTAIYPPDFCKKRIFWQPLPSPEDVIAYGYNAVRGPVERPIFNLSSYEAAHPCRLQIQPRGTRQKHLAYRLPGFVKEYSFHAERAWKITFTAFETAADAFKYTVQSNGLFVDKVGHDMHFTLRWPLHHQHSVTVQESRLDAARNGSERHLFYVFRAQAVIGSFELKPSRALHLTRAFAHDLRTLADRNFSGAQVSTDFFEAYGTHFPHYGTFGGVHERRVRFENFTRALCMSNLRVYNLTVCDASRLKNASVPATVIVKSSDGETMLEHADLAARNMLCYKLNDVHRITSQLFTSGGDAVARTFLAQPDPLLKDVFYHERWQQWLDSLASKPSTVEVHMASICDLVHLVSHKVNHTKTCEQRLQGYLRRNDHVLLGAGTTADRMQCFGFRNRSHSRLFQTHCAPIEPINAKKECPAPIVEHTVRTGSGGPSFSGKRKNGASADMLHAYVSVVSVVLVFILKR